MTNPVAISLPEGGRAAARCEHRRCGRAWGPRPVSCPLPWGRWQLYSCCPGLLRGCWGAWARFRKGEAGSYWRGSPEACWWISESVLAHGVLFSWVVLVLAVLFHCSFPPVFFRYKNCSVCVQWISMAFSS